ncbi:MAG TPA: FGGY family carbohydrate kinase [Propionibacteriaceae bacterium]
MDLLLGVDLGTTACKVTVVASDLTTSSISSPPYPISAPHREWAEQDPRTWGEAVDTTVQHALDSVGASARDHVTLAITGQMHSLVLMDGDGNPSRPAILWADRRATAECTMIETRVPNVAAITGNPPLPAFTLPQLLWVRRHEPDVLSRTSNVLLPKDYLRWRYTGRVVTDWTDASGTGMLDSATREWSTAILSALDLDLGLLPPVLDPIADGGAVERSANPALQAARTAVGVGDQFAEALSAGLTHAGDMAIILGTSAVVLGVSDHPVPGSFCHAQPDLWLRLDSLHAGGKSLQWLRDIVAPGESLASFTSDAMSAPPGARDLLFLPFLMGERGARGGGAPGAFLGLTTEHGRDDLVRAVLEGVAFELRRLQQQRGTPLPTDVLTLKGGGAQNELWCQIVSGVFGIPYRTTHRDAAFGAAMTAGVSQGWWPNWQSVPALKDPINESGLADVAILNDRYGRYCEVVDALTPHS